MRKILLFGAVLSGLAIFFLSPAVAGQKDVRRTHVQKAPSAQQVREHRQNMMWDMGERAINQAANFIPGPSGAVSGHVWSCGLLAPLNLIFSAFRASIMEDRELGNGEAMGIFLNSCFNPIGAPLSPFFHQMGINMWKNKDLCRVRAYRDYPGVHTARNEQPERDIIPIAARHSWYEQRYCGRPRDRTYDALLKDVGMRPRSLDRATGSYGAVHVQRHPHAVRSGFAAPAQDVRQFWPATRR